MRTTAETHHVLRGLFKFLKIILPAFLVIACVESEDSNSTSTPTYEEGDVTVTSSSFSSSYANDYAGNDVTFAVSLESETTKNNVYVEVSLYDASSDPIADQSNDVFEPVAVVGGLYVDTIEAGTIVDISTDIQIPTDVTPDTYKLIYRINPANLYGDSDFRGQPHHLFPGAGCAR